ncbi:RNA-directed DNA polymerase, eukaryota [Tanacetum coccineum]
MASRWYCRGGLLALTSRKEKIQNLISIIRAWVASKKSESSMIKRDHESRLASIDAKVDQGCANEEDFINREENTSFFHGMLKKKRRQLAIKGILKNGEWIEDPAMVKAEFLDHFLKSLEIQFSLLKKSSGRLWECGGDRDSQDMILTFSFKISISTFWDLIKVDVVRFVHEFFLIDLRVLQDFLDLVMEKLSFGHKWRSWIYGCLHNARSSILINGSPTSEFKVFRGLRQGDPLSPFLFILVMEGLHLLTYDVIFIGERSWQNAHNLLCMLCCFYLIYVLKINVNKSNIFGVSVTWLIPLVVGLFSSKLATWKARLLSVGGHLFLIKLVLGHLPTYYMSIYLMHISIQKKLESIRNNFFLGGDVEEKKITWVRWKKCLASKDLGGLGIGSIFGFNIGLLFKWIWRFFHFSSDLWARVIKNIYGPCGGINDTLGNRLSHSTWGGILSSIKHIKQKGIDLLSYCVRKIGDGTSTRFWEDTWTCVLLSGDNHVEELK